MLRFTTLRHKLYAIIFASFIARVVGFFLLPSTPSSLGPDEGNYGLVAEWTALGMPAYEFPLFGSGLYTSVRAFIWPATFFNRIGIDPLHSVRLTAAIYGFLSLILIARVILKAIEKNYVAERVEFKYSTLTVALFATFAFLPSHFVWSLLGLRESAIEFWTLCAFTSFYQIFYLSKRLSLEATFLLIAAIVFAFSSRPQVGWVIVIAFLIFLLINMRKRISLLLIPIVLISLVLGFIGTTDTTGTPGTPGTPGTGTPGTGTTASKIFNPLKTAAKTAAYKHQVNQLAATSVIVTQSCPRDDGLAYTSRPPTSFDTYFCIAWRAPYMSATFLFRPLIGVDVTSTASLFAAIENIAWLGVLLFIVVILIRKRRLAFFGLLAPPLIFFMLYCVGAGSYEGNMGTAFRHKSLILWVVLLLLASVIAAGKKTNSGIERPQKAV